MGPMRKPEATNTIGPLVETRFGYHVIEVLDRKPARSVPFEEARPRIERFIRRQKGQEAVESYVEQLRRQAQIQYPDHAAFGLGKP